MVGNDFRLETRLARYGGEAKADACVSICAFKGVANAAAWQDWCEG